MSDNQRWAWPTTSTTRWTHDEIEELKHELSCTARGLDPFFERCADALGSLQFDLIDATKAYDVVIAERTVAEIAALRASAELAQKAEPSPSAWVIAGQWIGDSTQRRRLAKMFDDFARQAVANKRSIINEDTKLSRCEAVCSNLMKMLHEKQTAMEVLFDRLTKAGVDCSDLFS